MCQKIGQNLRGYLYTAAPPERGKRGPSLAPPSPVYPYLVRTIVLTIQDLSVSLSDPTDLSEVVVGIGIV